MITRQIGDYSISTGQWPIDPDKATLFFIHGAALSKGLWQYQVDELADMVNTVSIDLPGHGQSPGNGYDTISDYANSVIDLLKNIKISKLILCGLSMGGAVAQHLLIHQPHQFYGGILMHTGARLKVMPMIFETIKQDYKQYTELMISFATAGQTDKLTMTEVLSDIVSWNPEVALKDFYACDNFDEMGSLSRIQVPVMVITGDEDLITPHKYGEYLAGNISGARLVTIKGAGHLSPIEKPESVNQAIRKYLNDFKSDDAISI